MTFIADKDGTLHDIEDGACAPTGTEFPTGQAAFDNQEFEIHKGKAPLTIQHFCQICLPAASWEQVIAK